MVIAGLQSLSLVDFPGYLASVVFVQGCNFNCGYCHNKDLVTLDKHFDYSEDKIFDFLTRRKDLIEGVVISGGEPALYKKLPDFIKRVKDIGFKVKLDTNGSDPDCIREILQKQLIDYIAIDIKTSFSKYSLVTGRKDIERQVTESIRIVMGSDIAYEFRTTCVPGIVGEEDFRVIGETIKGAKKYCLQQFRPYNTFDKKFEAVKPYSKETLEKFKALLEDFALTVEVRGI